MKIILTFFLAIVWINGFSQKLTFKSNQRIFALPKNIKATDYIPNTIIIKYRTNTKSINNIKIKSAFITSVINKFPSATNNIPQTGKTPNQSLKVNVTKPTVEVDLTLIYEIKYSGSVGIEDMINELLKDNNVEYAEPHYINHTFYTPNDSLYTMKQNYLCQVKAPQAWDIIKNSASVTIAIVDNGSDLTHADLANNIFLNNADPINGIDDDHDGYIDNYRGWDLVGASSSATQPDNDPNIKNANAGHGAHVSGLASAISDNNIGVASIAFNAKLLIVKAATEDDPSAICLGYEGIKYAADHGAQIINCSWGSTAGGMFGQDIINYALSKNCLVIAAAGNSGNSDPIYPAAYCGVLAVASVQETDVRSPTSNFGSYVDISAPGTNILSTVYPNNYGLRSGTSISSPIVSSAAALVKSFFPALTMEQVGEKLRVTADFIDDKNPNLTGMLGKGRLNVYNALTQSLPSIRNQKLTVNSPNNGLQGDTMLVYFDLKNFLDPATGLIASLSSLSPFVRILTPQVYVGNIATLQTVTLIGPFKVYVLPTAPDNSLASFRISYGSNGNSYNDSEGFSIPIGLDYLNIQVNDIATTMTSNGRVGYSKANATTGLGFIYKNQNLLYEASLMIGNSPVAVSNNARNGNNCDEHFIKKVRAKRINNPAGDFEGISEFDDSANPKSLNLYIKQRQIAYADSPDDKYCIVEYEVFNNGNTELRNIFIGMFTDWDVAANRNDVTKYDPFFKLAYVHSKIGNSKYAGVKLLTSTAPPLYYPLSAEAPGNLLTNGFTTDKKYQTLSNGIKAIGLGGDTENGYDVSFVSGYGPFIIPPKGSVKVAFAFLAGDDLNDLEKSAEAAQNKYQNLLPDNVPDAQLQLKQNYPNPLQNNTLIEFSIPYQGLAILDIINLAGEKIQTLLKENLKGGNYSVNVNAANLKPGVYIYRLNFGNTAKALKMIVAE